MDVKKEGLTPLANWLIQQKVTLCHLSVALFRNSIDTLTGEEEFPHVRLIRLASQTVIPADVELYKKHFSANCYHTI